MNKKNVLFIWIPKTAGTSIYNVLKKYECRKLKHYHQYKNFNNQGWVTFNHVNVFKLLKINILSYDFFKNAFKFAFVRNPWDRLVSLYFYRKKFCNITSQFRDFEEFCVYLKGRIQGNNNFLTNLIKDKLFGLNNYTKLIFRKINAFEFNNSILNHYLLSASKKVFLYVQKNQKKSASYLISVIETY